MTDPTTREWAALYQAAIEFHRTAPWQWMHDTDLFAVENPADRTAGYCCVLGAVGEAFGFAMYLGAEGFEYYTSLVAGEADPESFEGNVSTPSLSVMFVDRGVLRKEDHEVIRSLGLRFRGRNAWPVFSSQRPGYAPWFLEKEEAAFLTVAIQQGLVVATEMQKNGGFLLGKTDDDVFTRRCVGGEWTDAWCKAQEAPAPPRAAGVATGGLSKAIQRLAGRTDDRAGTWELDVFPMELPVAEGKERPYYPVCFLAVEKESRFIVGTSVTEPWISTAEWQARIVHMLDTSVLQLPSQIWVRSEGMRGALAPIASALGIDIKVGALKTLNRVKADMLRHLLDRGMQ
ncbi:MAG: hypothetical protein HYY32_04825 [Chloroflexi bacterium]|nr:hypothetical protein [Chloroflexota bacterium]